MSDFFRPNLFYCIKAIEHLKRFQDLIRHHQSWAYDVGFARPIKDLIPEHTPEKHPQLMEKYISRMIPTIRDILGYARIGIDYIVTDKPQIMQKDAKPIEHNYNLVSDYFRLREKNAVLGYELVMQAIEKGIGFYEEKRKEALWDLFNPIVWIAWFIRLPITILDRAGIKGSHTIMGNIYGWLIRLVMLIILLLACAKLKISIPWEKIGNLLGKS